MILFDMPLIHMPLRLMITPRRYLFDDEPPRFRRLPRQFSLRRIQITLLIRCYCYFDTQRRARARLYFMLRRYDAGTHAAHNSTRRLGKIDEFSVLR